MLPPRTTRSRSTPFEQPAPPRRPLRIYAFDPMVSRTSPRTQVTVDIRNERLEPGPRGERIHVIDYDAANRCYYEPVDLEDPRVVMQDGLDPSATDPRFHQQMVYAVASNVLENFDFALGHRIRFRGNRPLRLFPHALQSANAFYDRELLAILFGYFRADDNDPGPNIPGQIVFTCLSQDIIAHETSHALVDRLRPHFIEPSNRDVAAFHEGFADIVAIFQHFTFPGILRDVIQQKRTNLHESSALADLAAQFGFAKGGNSALRTALSAPDRLAYRRVAEPHARGSILVAAVFDAFFATYQRRIADLIRIATGGTGRLPDADLHPDLVNRIANEAAKTAQQVLTMCIRAFDYLPPVDVTYGDYLRALVTADIELEPADQMGLRASMIESFRARGIYAEGVGSLAEENVQWQQASFGEFPVGLLGQLAIGARELVAGGGPAPYGDESAEEAASAYAQVPRLEATVSQQLLEYAAANTEALQLDPVAEIVVAGFHPAFRVAADGSLKIELVAELTQQERGSEDELGGIPFRGGTTVVASADGKVRYAIAKGLTEERRAAQREYLEDADQRDTSLAWTDEASQKTRVVGRMSFQALHEGRS